MMKKNKLLIAFLLVLASSLFSLFAGADWENVLLCQPTNVINNQSVMIEMSQAKTINHDSAFGSVVYTAPYKPKYEDQGDIVLMALIDTLDSSKNGSSVTFTIESDDPAGFYFVKDGNETNKVRYELEACFLEFEKSFNIRKLSIEYPKTSNGKKMRLGIEENCGESKKTKFEYNGTNKYTISIPTTSYSSILGWGWLGDYPQHLRFYYICVHVLGGQNLEEGSYSSSFHVRSSDSSIPSTKYTIKGYVGEKPVADSTEFSFFIGPAADSYFTDLVVAKNTTSPSKDIASLQFYFTRKGTYSSEPSANTYKKKFTIYISPTNDYAANARFVFKKTGTENQADSFANRIYYEIDTTNTTGLTKYSNNTNNYSYYFYPDYSSQLLSSSGNNKNYQEFWKLEGKHIYIKVSEDSKETNDNMHSSGTYSSTIWFIIVPNDSL